jgi:NAD(P)-dependent dehydrogenase (short-subunit alcohol dehydrogenase family)
MTLANQSVVIVGASSGIGLATAKLAADAGARVIMLSRSQHKLDEAFAQVRGAQGTAMDMLDRSAVKRVIGALPEIDHLVLTAVADELASRARIEVVSDEQVERAFDKLRGYVNVIRAAGSHLRATSSITMLTGASALKPPRDGFTLLAAASGALISFGKALALELAPVRVNVILSGVVDTPIQAASRDQVRAWAEHELPTRRFGKPEDLAEAIALAMTNRYMTASVLTVDGGLLAL